MKFTPVAIVITLVLLITLSVACRKKDNDSSSVINKSTFDFTWTEAVASQPVTFTSTAPVNSKLLWQIGPKQYMEATPKHVFGSEGSYQVSLTVDGDVTKKVSKTVIVSKDVRFDYKGSELSGDTTWFFTSNAPAGATFAWDFGDGTKSTDASPTHIYQNSGNYTIKLRINNQFDAVGISQIAVVDDPLYTYKITGNRVWQLKRTHGDSIYNTNKTFSITPVDKIKISMPALDHFFGAIQLKYDQSLSSGNVLVFREYSRVLYYDHVMDTLYLSGQRLIGKAEYVYITGSSK